MQAIDLTLEPMLRKLQLWAALDPSDCAAILALPYSLRKMRANEFIAREDERVRHSCLLLAGFAYRHKVAGNGGRQIFSMHMKGDVVDLHNSILRRADQNVQALSAVEAAFIPVEAIRGIVADRPQVGQAMWYETLVDAAIFREWALNIGRRDARTRTAHMLCELAVRMEVAGLGARTRFELPTSQEQLGDALALTNVHVSRTLKELESEGVIAREKRMIDIVDFGRLATLGDFHGGYLHLDRANYPDS